MEQQLSNYLLDEYFQCDKQSVSDKLESELFFGITYLLGAEIEALRVIDELKTILEDKLAYRVYVIDVADIIQSCDISKNTKYNYRELMEHAQHICCLHKNRAALMCGAIDKIIKIRNNNTRRNAYIINAIKRPEEFSLLKKIYREAFFLIGIYMPEPERKEKLRNEIPGLEDNEIDRIMIEDEKSSDTKSGTKYGTNSKAVYHQADALIDVSSNSKKFPLDSSENSSVRVLNRLINLIFGNPYYTPTFHEHAMFMAFCNSIHSSDLSRQVGAALCLDNQIIALGANECQQSGGLPYFTNEDYSDFPHGKDYTRNCDSNSQMINKVIKSILDKYNEFSRGNNTNIDENILNAKGDNTNIDENILKDALKQSELRSITEYGRMVHAEMNAITNCARRGVSTNGGVLYCTTFPCHNCAKHIVAAGIRHIYFVEPYPKSKALELFDDSIVYHYDQRKADKRVVLEPYIGITAKRYHDLFSIKNNYGYNLKRKDTETDNIIDFSLNHNSHPRFIVPIFEYKAMETVLSNLWNDKINH